MNSGKICQSCAKAKAKQKSVPHSRRAPRLTIPNKRMYHNLATVKAPVDGAEKSPKPNRQLTVNKATGIKFTTFHKSKNDICNDTSARLKTMEQLAGREIQIWRQDNARENTVLEQNMKSQHWLMKTKFEYTTYGTLQQNSYADMDVTALAGMLRAMMNLGNVPRKIATSYLARW